jgi:probable rRNA maturation factor
VDPRVVRRRAGKMLQQLSLQGVELSIALVDDRVIRELNRDYRRLDRPTDVLAFAMEEGEALAEPAGAPTQLGDVVISVPSARRQARARRRSVGDEVTMLLAHGLLHLLGHDHRTRREEQRMSRLTAELEAAARRPSPPR